ncbi:MAG: hypothetical protein FJX46_03070, partial [Alphaproteobacteria bacterium]|nr:hypothetical protein [Alphaproteobacteria bacterium]
MTKVDEMLLMAYVDGEVDAATAREIETQLAREPETQAHVTRMREQSALLRAAFAPVGQEIVPDGLRRAAMGAPMPRQAAAGGRRFAMPL